MSTSSRRSDAGSSSRGMVIVGGVFVAVFALGYYAISSLIASDAKPVKQVVEIQVVRPPPPPPPPKVEEEPPPPELEEEEIDVPEEEVPDVPEMPDMPAPESPESGLDADGVAGSDAFGLLANKGGRGLIGGAGRYRWYASKVVDEVNDLFNEVSAVRRDNYTVSLLLWIGEDGGIERYRLLSSTGDAELDGIFEQTLSGVNRLLEPPPAGMPQPVRIRIESRV